MTGATTVETRPATTDGGGVRDRIGRVLLWLAAVGALAAALGAYGTVADAEPAVKVVETWRAYGFLVFAGLFALLAVRPRGYRGVWPLVIFHKLAMTVTALVYTRNAAIEGTGTVLIVDGALSVLLVLALVLCRGWVAEPRR
ncbi:hypothetical protein GCE86_20730 [Micromonospora terminaliae]|uniref:Uncharacterized protein n=1 Tax=Micromonospora terminaliae TaxID=1914461 RepID=A0AAJ2ZH04_9ACTN|nr:hypothetical protein [Micromonospora terminaliae]NES28739.1 hypothetical protein [Micromonospora terminaliae]QGL49229.1 hypothetical protein GCE86_20730 [Micromonospora terminaliae]